MSADVWEVFSARLFDQNQFAIKLGLDNIRRAFESENHPEHAAPAIVVGGTNGKGSTAAYLAAILQAHGLRVGLYTSPHLRSVRERFRVDGRPVSRETVLRVGRYALDSYGQAGADPVLTFFELTTLMAAMIFAESKVDVVIWEVGLGGRLDAVNAVEPALTVVTNIDLDHQEYLGDTLAEVASEKAALRRPGVPLILGVQSHPAVLQQFEFPETRRVSVDNFGGPPTIDWQNHRVEGRSFFENRAAAILAAETYLGDHFNPENCERGLRRARWPGRLDPRTIPSEGGPFARRFLLDAAHNPGGTRRLYEVFRHDPPGAVVVTAMKDKDHPAMFAPLTEAEIPVLIATLDSDRAASRESLAASLRGAPVEFRGNPDDAFDASSQFRGYTAVFGSIFLLAEWFEWATIGAEDLTTWQEG